MFVKPDLHLHTDFSDGTDTPLMLLENVRKSGVDVFSLTDHDEYAGAEIIRQRLCPEDPAFICGIEFSCKDERGKCHILGYGFDSHGSRIAEICEYTRAQRRDKLEGRIMFLRENGYSLSEESINRLRAVNNSGKPHIVNELIAAGLVDSKNAGYELLHRCREEEGYLTPEQAIDAITASRGISVLAHAPFGDGHGRLSPEETEERVARLAAHGLRGLECGYSSFSLEQTGFMLELARRYKLLVTAGSDYHGSNKPVRIGDCGCAAPEYMKEFYEAVFAKQKSPL